MTQETKKIRPHFKNPHLDGDPFFWQAGPVGVLLIHGFKATTAEIRPVAKALLAKGYTVSGPLLPGHGTTPEDANRYRWQDWVKTAEDDYRKLTSQCDQVFVGGESTGGLLALYLGIHYPQVAGILTYAPALKLVISPVDLIRLHLIAPFVPYLPQEENEDEDDEMAWQGYTVNPLRGVIQLLRLQRQVKPRLASIRRPVLVIQGRLDPTVHPTVPETIYSGVRSTLKEIHWLEHSTHCVALDREQDQVIALTLQFLEKAI
jgi:carboxylesterase